MLIKNLRIKSLLLALISLNVSYTYATGVIDITSDATAEEISAAKEILETPTLQNESAYQLEEVTGDVEESDFTITKYIYNSETCDLTGDNYNVVFGETFGTDVANTFLYFKWSIDDEGNRALVSTDKNDAEIIYGVFINTINYSDISLVVGDTYITISRSFANFYSSDSGGAIYNNGAIGSITGDFVNNEASRYGGAIYSLGEIGDVTGDFSSNYANYKGGAIYNSGQIGDIIGDFSSNASKYEGGAIYNSAIVGDITGCFISNVSENESGYGGAIYNSATIGDITGCFISNVSENEAGGAIYSLGTIGDIVGDFIGNSAYSSGGAIVNRTGIIGNITGDFIGNCSSEYGGAILNSNGDIANIIGDFIGNITKSGGAIYNSGDIANIIGDFIGNIAVYGSAVYNEGNIGSITGDFLDNSGPSGLSNSGSAIFNDGYIGTVTVDFVSNNSCIYNSEKIDDVTANFIDSTSYGIYNTDRIGNVSGGFIGNSGYGIYNTGRIENVTCEFIDNSGYGIYNKGAIGNVTCYFASNSKYSIYNYDADIEAVFGTFSSNSMSAIFVSTSMNGTASIESINANFISNSSAYGGAILISNGSSSKISNSTIGGIIGNFEDNYATDNGGAVCNNGSLIGSITGQFINNEAESYGGAIFNSGDIGDVEADFSYNSATHGGAIYNDEYAEIGDIRGCFSYNSSESMGAAIYNDTRGVIGDIIGDFTYNSSNGGAYSSIIYNYYGTIGNITGDFIGNTGNVIYNVGTIGDISGNVSDNDSRFIYNNKGSISEVQGVFTNNTGGILYNNNGIIDKLSGVFLNNSLTSNTHVYGGVVLNSGSYTASIGCIEGNFINNSVNSSNASSGGGAIRNTKIITSVAGNFVSNTASASSLAYGGAIYNTSGTIEFISGNFIGNYASSITSTAKGGAIFNSVGVIGITACYQDIQFVGNYTVSEGVKVSNAIYNAGYSSGTSTINMNAYSDYSININDGIDGSSDYVAKQIININANSEATSTISFNNTVANNTLNVYNGTLELREYEGGEVTLTGLDTDEDGVDDTMTVESSSAMLSNCVLNIDSSGTVNTKADYLGSTSTITNNGTLNISGGTLTTSVAGAGIMNILGDVSASSGSMTVVADSTLNSYATLAADLTVEDGADVNAIITWDNLGETIFDGSITGITSMDVSFDLSLDFNDVVGTITTVYSEKSDGITLELVDSEHISGVIIAGNTIVVAEQIDVSTDDYSATVGKVDDKTYIDVTTGSFEIAEGETQTLSGITTGEDATLVISGGTLVTDNNFTLANDDATSGVKADSGVIESTATVELSEGTTSVASGATLEVKAELNLADDTQATFGSSDASLVLQKDITLGENSVLTLDGNISGSANIIGNGTATINYTGVFSPGNSPELISYTDTTVNYMGGSILEMEIFGEAGAGVDGGHDKIVFYGCNVSFDGTIQLNIDDVASLMGEEQSKTITIDLFDFEGGTSIVSFDADFDLVYDSNGWFVVADTSNLLTTGEVSLSITAIPEPSTATLSLLALAGMLARRRRNAA